MAVSNDDIKAWLAANPSATDTAIAAKMNEFGVTPAQMAAATGADPASVQSRYTAATASAPAPNYSTSNADINAWLAANPSATDSTIAAKMQQFGVTPAQMAQATGADPASVQARYTAAAPGSSTPVAATAPTTGAPPSGLDQAHIDAARNWITSQWGISPNATGEENLYSAAFNPNGTYNASDMYRNRAVLGAGVAQGYNTADMSQILGIPADQIAAYSQNLGASTLRSYADLFNADQNSGFYRTGQVANSGRTADTYTRPYAINRTADGAVALFNGGGSHELKGADAYNQLTGTYGQPSGQQYTGTDYRPPSNYDFAGLGYAKTNPQGLLSQPQSSGTQYAGLLSGTAPVKNYTPPTLLGGKSRAPMPTQQVPPQQMPPQQLNAQPWMQTIANNLTGAAPNFSGIRQNPYNLGF